MKTYFRLLKYAKPYAWCLFFGFIFASILSSVSVLIIPIVGKLSAAIASRNFAQLNEFIWMAIGLYFLKGLFSFCHIYFISLVNQGVLEDLRVQIFEHLQNLSLDFYAKTRTGDLITLVMNDISVMQSVIVTSFISLVPNMMTIAGILGYLFYLNWRLTLVSIVLLPMITYLSSKFAREVREIATKTQEKMSDIASTLHEVITGAKVVKSFTMEEEEIKKFRHISDFAKEIALKATAISATQTPLFNFIQALAAVIVIWVGGFEILSGRIAISDLIAFFSGVLMLGDPIGELSGMNISIQMALISADRVFRVLDTKPTVKETPNAKEVQSLLGEVIFRNVSFKYESNENTVLKNINITCLVGEVIAIVGHSGAGKSTLVSLVPRFYDPVEGEIIIDGNNLKDYKIISFRKFIGIVPQETLLFSGSIKENIAYGRMNASEKEIEDVAKMANAHDFIMSFPQKYDTTVGEKGIKLSGGERQRIAIARAFLRDPKILILDEATSSLDSESERAVQDALGKLMKGRTTFVIAHRLSTLQFANRIIVLNKGEIVEEGTHQELLNKGGYYQKLYEMQLGRFAKTLPRVFGYIDLEHFKVNYGNINTIRGWLIADDNSEITKVQITSDGGEVLALGELGIERPDVKMLYPNYKLSLNSGFSIEFRASEDRNKIYSLEIFDHSDRKIKNRYFKPTELEAGASIPL